LEDGEQQYAAGVAELDTKLADGRKQLEDAEKKLKEGAKELEDAKVKLETERAKADVELADAEKQLNDSEKELEDAEEEYEEGLAEYNQAVKDVEAELSDARSQIASGRQQMSDVETGKWYVFDRDDIVVQHANLRADAKRISAIADVFPVFFLMVAALVCLTTMSRLIDEQRTQMGTYKALGYTQMEIASKYLLYAAAACIGGCIIGPVVCVNVLPAVIFGAYSVLYSFPDFTPVMPYNMLAISVVVALACTVLVAAVASFRELRETTAQIMRPKAPKVGKQIFLEKMPKLWNRFSFFQKLTARNLFRYKARLIMTVIGIGGCMALVVAGFGLRDAINPIMDLQFKDIQDSSIIMNTMTSLKADELEDITAQMDEDLRIYSYMATDMAAVKAYDQDETKMMDEIYLYVPLHPDEVHTYLDLRTKKQESLELGDDGAIITEKIARTLGLSAGDTVRILLGEERYNLKIVAVAENYVYNYIYISPAYYEEITGEECAYNCFYVTESDRMTSREEYLNDWLVGSDDFISVTFMEDTYSMMDDTLSSLKLVVLVMIVCAGALAFVVLFNLTNINIAERLREIATVKVLGFNHRETNSYVFRENLIMSLLGVLVGCVLGWLMARYLVNVVEVNTVTFYRKVNPESYLYSAGITMLFTVLVNLFMRKRIRDISMVESLKAVE